MTCNECKHKDGCIMSAPDGNWKACEDYERDCDHCTNHTSQGCTKWDCEFERRE